MDQTAPATASAIVRHSFGLLARNWLDSIRIFLVPFLLALILWEGLADLTSHRASFAASEWWIPSLSWPTLLGLLVFWMLIAGWTGVAWHRFVLKNDVPKLLPKIRIRTMLKYLTHLFVLTVICFGTLLTSFFLMMPVLSGDVRSAVPQVIGPLLALTLGGWIMARLGLILPASAVEHPISIGDSWNITRPAAMSLALIVLGIVLLGSAFFAGVRHMDHGLLSVILWALGHACLFVFGLSVLTTVYGHLAEGRPIA